MWLIAARAVSGVGAAFVMPSTLSILTAEFPAHHRGRAVGIWAGVAGSGAILGILCSGLLLEHWSWESVFIGGLASAVAFVVVELRREHPLLDLRPVRRSGIRRWHLVDRAAVSGAVRRLPAAGAISATRRRLRPAPVRAGVGLIIVPIVGISLPAPWLAQRWGLRLLTVSGLLTIAAGMFLASRLDAGSSYTDFLWPLLILGTGLGLCAAPAMAAVVAAVPVEKHGVAAAVNDAAREVGAAVGIAIAGSVLAAGYTSRIAPALPAFPAPAREPVSDSLAAALEVADSSGPAGSQLADTATSAFVHGYSQGAVVLSIITVAGAIVLAVWSPGRRAPAGPDTRSEERPDDGGNDADAGLDVGLSVCRHARPDGEPQ